jgi:electron transport complex protein RnfC
MILEFPGGARPSDRTRLGKKEIEYIADCSASCIRAEADRELACEINSRVKRGSLIGKNGETPIYSPLAGIFRGIMELEGIEFFVVTADGSKDEEVIFAPETRSINDLTPKDIKESAKKFGIIDTRSGIPLWKLLEKADENCNRVVIDGTETDSLSAINYRLSIEHAKEIVGGAKILMKASGAIKCVYAAEYYRSAAFNAVSEYATDEKIFAMAQLDEKYPYGDFALMYALYVKKLNKKQTALDEGVLIVSPETAIALYNSMTSGMPQLDRYITVCGEGIKNGANLCVPRGTTLRDISNVCGGLEEGYFFAEDSLFSGQPVYGAVYDTTHALIAVDPIEKIPTDCIACGECANVCPVKLLPNEVLAGDGERMLGYCIGCGACEYICPSNIPLLKLINKEAKK